MFKDLWSISIEALRVFESNIRLFRQETEKREFLESLFKLSVQLKNKREEDFRKSIKGNFRSNTNVKK